MTDLPAKLRMNPERYNFLLDEFSWPPGTLAGLRGLNASTTKKWGNGKQDIDPRDAAWMERTYELLQLMREEYHFSPDSDMEYERFNEIMDVLHWCPTNYEGGWPWFSEIIGVPQQDVWEMGKGKRPIPAVIADGLEEIMQGVKPRKTASADELA